MRGGEERTFAKKLNENVDLFVKTEQQQDRVLARLPAHVYVVDLHETRHTLTLLGTSGSNRHNKQTTTHL